jgi:hypothetical protein
MELIHEKKRVQKIWRYCPFNLNFGSGFGSGFESGYKTEYEKNMKRSLIFRLK